MAMRKAGDYLAEFASGAGGRNGGSNTYQPKFGNFSYSSKGEEGASGSTLTPAEKQSRAAAYVGAGNSYGTGETTESNNLRTMMHSATNDLIQDKYRDRTSGIAQRAIDNAEKNRYINTEGLDRRISEREMYNRAQGDVGFSQIFGDMWAQKAPSWNSAEPGQDVEPPDFEEMYDKYNPMED